MFSVIPHRKFHKRPLHTPIIFGRTKILNRRTPGFFPIVCTVFP